MTSPTSFEQLVEVWRRMHEEPCVRSVRVVDDHLVVRNGLFGRYIAELEQDGAD